MKQLRKIQLSGQMQLRIIKMVVRMDELVYDEWLEKIGLFSLADTRWIYLYNSNEEKTRRKKSL